MPNDANFYGPLNYNFVWIVFGCLCLLTIIAIYAIIIYFTRKKPVKALSTLQELPPKIIDKDALKQRYFALIAQVEQKYNNREIKASVAHQQLSLLARLFFCDLHNFHADVMTLRDLKKSRYQDLAALIECYYPDEFDMLEKGNVKNSADFARQLIGAQ